MPTPFKYMFLSDVLFLVTKPSLGKVGSSPVLSQWTAGRHAVRYEPRKKELHPVIAQFDLVQIQSSKAVALGNERE